MNSPGKNSHTSVASARQRDRQRGSTLIVGLVMLVVLTLLVLSAMRSSNINLRIAGNTQLQKEAVAAAKEATEKIISSNFTAAPVATSLPITEGDVTYTAQISAPTCLSSVPLSNANLNPQNPNDATCITSAQAGNGVSVSGVAPATAGQSWCLSQQWEVRAAVTGATGATATTHQGVSMRVMAGTGC